MDTKADQASAFYVLALQLERIKFMNHIALELIIDSQQDASKRYLKEGGKERWGEGAEGVERGRRERERIPKQGSTERQTGDI